MRTKSFLIAAISVISLLLVAAGLALAKGKPDKPPKPGSAPYTATFADNPGDALKSDGGGAYTNVDILRNGGFEIDTKDRTAFLDLSNCLTGLCPRTPFDPDTSGYLEASITFFVAGGEFEDMVIGVPTLVHVKIQHPEIRKKYWEFLSHADDSIDSMAIANDLDGDGDIDQYIISVGTQSIFRGAIYDLPRSLENLDSENSIPFSVTIDKTN